MDTDVLDEIEPIKPEIKGLPFPEVIERLKAVLTDSLVIVGLMILIGTIFSNFKNVPESLRMFAFIFVFGLYDPIFTSLFGGTIGHRVMGLRIKRDDNSNKNIPFLNAVLRYFFKVFLGFISLLTVSNNEKGKAIHDIVAKSVVVYKKI